ncbi:MAG: hypothetical protein JXR30_02495 [Alphaproteobacteria bacterium]|nr:hypothetical protein [Alphaproteobacteria bacterium]
MRLLFLAFGLFLTISFVLPKGGRIQATSSIQSTKIKGLFLCETYGTISEKSSEIIQGFSLVDLIKIFRNLVFLGCFIWCGFYLFKGVFMGTIPWKELHEGSFIFLVTLFIWVVIHAFIIDTKHTSQYYQDIRHPNLVFEKCHKGDMGASFVQARYIRKIKGD